MGSDSRVNQKVIFMCGASHSGSTLLGLILGSHSQCFYIGEATKTRFLNLPSKPPKKQNCKICGTNCPMWKDFIVDPDSDIYEQIAIRTQKPVLIDSTKEPSWVKQQIEVLEKTTAEIYLIFLQRDGRAVLNSVLRKYPEKSIDQHIDEWLERIHAAQRLFDDFRHTKLTVRYELLATQADAIIAKTANVLKLSHQPEMLQFYLTEHHPLGGNNGTQFLVAKAQMKDLEQSFIDLPKDRYRYYNTHPVGVALDLRWMDELEPYALRRFEERAGKMNELFCWDPY
ncbi:sulfotransferase [Leptolyngbya cf. ectocarpi LEGE 11479]|uniref:Sulfotransferase n=1 Tax=Leptolyngbya cf. ectocarpi LEGE 11479 TaxID=1828722 RepID=A0A929FBJ2_LEPEC|nr:sulfotransferase [Leptolyngbya ectocarpi]MBE9069039.1 sulfotransferase [Leptolyngbya cf. ectocarpi LEGE 11479]